jgi:hypothetical protein
VTADAKFPGRYSEQEWRLIAQEVEHVSMTAPDEARDELEYLARMYLAAKSPPSPVRAWWTVEHGKFLERKRKQLMAVRRSIMKSADLDPANEADAEDAFSKLDNILKGYIDAGTETREVEKLTGGPLPSWMKLPSGNAIDNYFRALADFWRRIGGVKKPPGRKTTVFLISFIQACASPVVMDKKSLTRTAISARLRRFSKATNELNIFF